MKEKLSYNYAFVFYDVGEKRVQKVFKICKKYFKHHQKSVFRGHITPSNQIALKNELKKVVKPKEDFITIIKFLSDSSFEEETIGTAAQDVESLFI